MATTPESAREVQAAGTATPADEPAPPPPPASPPAVTAAAASASAAPVADPASSSSASLQLPSPPPPCTLPAHSPSPKGILKRRRETAPEQQRPKGTDDPSVYMEGKRLRFRSMGDLERGRSSGSPSPAPLSPFAQGSSGSAASAAAAVAGEKCQRGELDAEQQEELEEGKDGLGRLPSDPTRTRKLVDINQVEELRESVQRLERFCEASVEWTMSLETQGNPVSPSSRMARRESLAHSPGTSPKVANARPFRPLPGRTSTTTARQSIHLSPKSARAHLTAPPLPQRALSDPLGPAHKFTDARRQSLPSTLQSAAASLVVMACQPTKRSKSFSHRGSISVASNVLPPMSAPSSPPKPRHSAHAALRRPSLAPKLPSFQDVVNADGAASPNNATQLLTKFRRMSQPNVHAAAAAETAAARETAASAASAAATPATAATAPAAPPTPLSARNLVRTYSAVLRDRLQSWEGLEGLVKDAEAVADDWDDVGMNEVELAYGHQPPPQQQQRWAHYAPPPPPPPHHYYAPPSQPYYRPSA